MTPEAADKAIEDCINAGLIRVREDGHERFCCDECPVVDEFKRCHIFKDREIYKLRMLSFCDGQLTKESFSYFAAELFFVTGIDAYEAQRVARRNLKNGYPSSSPAVAAPPIAEIPR